jgi:hypothetical protein
VREAARLGQKLADSLATSAVDRFPSRYLVGSGTPTAAPPSS